MASVSDFSSSLFQWVRLYVCRLVGAHTDPPLPQMQCYLVTDIGKLRVTGAVLFREMGQHYLVTDVSRE